VAKIINTADLLETSSLDHNSKEWVYNGLDCCVTLEIRDVLKQQLSNVTASTYAFSQALQAPILEMGMRGVLVDEGRRQKALVAFQEQIARLQAQLDTIVKEGIGFDVSPTKAAGGGWSLWWRSNTRLKNLFYDVMGLPAVRKRNAKGQYAPTVDRDALEQLAGKYFLAEPVILHLLALRDVDKKATWLKTEIDTDGRMRCNFNIAGTNTGRLASSYSDFGTGGNMQNVDRELRSVFVADPGMKFGNLDLEQGDARNVGAICWNLFVEKYGEKYAGSYLDACDSGDLHTYNSKLIWPEKAWTGDLKEDKKIAEEIFYRQDSFRQMSKKGGHGTNYYGTPRTMAKHLKVAIPVIQEFQQRYFGAYPVIGSYEPRKNDPKSELPNWHNYVKQQLQETHTITTMMGRQRQFFGRSFEDTTIREAIAYEPQSLTADIIDTGLLRLWRSNRVQLLVQVHDSILFQYPEELEDEIIPWALETLKVYFELKKGRQFVVPTEAKTGWNWGDYADQDAVDKALKKGDRMELNLDGLTKWKGHDARKRIETPKAAKRFSFSNLV
jgi:DNA polymerase-1